MVRSQLIAKSLVQPPPNGGQAALNSVGRGAAMAAP